MEDKGRGTEDIESGAVGGGGGAGESCLSPKGRGGFAGIVAIATDGTCILGHPRDHDRQRTWRTKGVHGLRDVGCGTC